MKSQADGRFVIFLDSIDQLDPANEGRQVLPWLPKTLPPNVKVILSTLEDAEYEAYPRLRVCICLLSPGRNLPFWKMPIFMPRPERSAGGIY